MNANTMRAIQRRLDNDESCFYLGKYYYECLTNTCIRRREQVPGYTPTSAWENITLPLNVD